MPHKEAEFEVVIDNSSSWFAIDLKELFLYRDLLWLLVRRDFVAKYKQTILGKSWYVVQPLITIVVFQIVFNKIAQIPTDGIPPTLFYFSGLLLWNYFAGSFVAVSHFFVGNSELFKKIYFPRLMIPIASLMSNLFNFSIQLLTFLLFFLYFKFFTPAGEHIHFSIFFCILPLVLLQTMLICLGSGLCISCLSVKYRDLQFLVGFFTQTWMYATPIIYPLSLAPEKWRFFMVLNPLTSVVELMRYAFFGVGAIRSSDIFISLGVTFAILIIGLMLFSRVQKSFIDTL